MDRLAKRVKLEEASSAPSSAAAAAMATSSPSSPSCSEACSGATAKAAQHRPLLDQDRVDKVKTVISAQFDYEILLKRQELATITDELERGQDILNKLGFLISSNTTIGPTRDTNANASPQSTLPTAPPTPLLLERNGAALTSLPTVPPLSLSPDATAQNPTNAVSATPSAILSSVPTGTGSLPATSVLTSDRINSFQGVPTFTPALPMPVPLTSCVSTPPRPASTGRPFRAATQRDRTYIRGMTPLYVRREDGSFVRITCPGCGRDNFMNMQGFINHCRISHQLEFTSHSKAAEIAGTLVEGKDVPDNISERISSKPTPALRKSASAVASTMSLEDPPQSMRKPKIREYEADVVLDPAGGRDDEEDDEMHDGVFSLHSTSGQDNDRVAAQLTDSGQIPIVKIEPNDQDFPMTPHHSTVDRIVSQSTSTPPLPASARLISPSCVPPPKAQRGYVHNNNHTVALASRHSDTTVIDPPKPTATVVADLLATLPHATSYENDGSRFYIKKRIVVGNISQFIPSHKRDPGAKKFMFKWMVYVRGPPSDPNPTSFLKKVRFYLHPDYRPNDIVEITTPPFHLVQKGYGEFPIRVQLFFADEGRNQPLDIIHMLKLDLFKTGKQVLGSELFYDVELDRNTVFEEAMPMIGCVDRGRYREKGRFAKLRVNGQVDDDEEEEVEEVDEVQRAVEKVLESVVVKYPLVKNATAIMARPPYTLANSAKEFLSWSIGKRKSIEFQRVVYMAQYIMRNHVQIQSPSHLSKTNPISESLSSLTPRQLVEWCREKGLTPQQASTPTFTNDVGVGGLTGNRAKEPEYCWFCGVMGGHGTRLEECRGGALNVYNQGVSSLTSESAWAPFAVVWSVVFHHSFSD
ncbi:hypothetical protein SeMB42_g03592 [Synchytrium endobioticum]|uniref:YEATS domain-containing protein n=1 Tax=Synchytrium endobioticum TaxID=286115 RepID=A0A507D5I1_9FUNG|nr:hypothetical protein SeMB42_g03592 [Synchytrium endobioticum]